MIGTAKLQPRASLIIVSDKPSRREGMREGKAVGRNALLAPRGRGGASGGFLNVQCDSAQLGPAGQAHVGRGCSLPED